jgi:hypothetical protein
MKNPTDALYEEAEPSSGEDISKTRRKKNSTELSILARP